MGRRKAKVLGPEALDLVIRAELLELRNTLGPAAAAGDDEAQGHLLAVEATLEADATKRRREDARS